MTSEQIASMLSTKAAGADMHHDVIVIGGSYAGLSAGLPLARVQDDDGALELVLGDGGTFALDGLFTTTQAELHPLVQQLGCTTNDGPLGSYIRVDAMPATSIPGVFACGDVASLAASVASAAASGALAGVATHRSLISGLASV